MTSKQVGFVRKLLINAGLHDQKEELVHQYTDGRTTHLTDMTHEETQAIIKSLRGDDPKEAMCNKILSLAHDMQWKTSSGKVDMKRINGWCMKFSKLKKPFNEFTEKELPELVTAFEKVYQSFLNSI